MTLETERLILSAWTEADAESLYEYAKDSDVALPSGWPVHQSVEQSREIIPLYLSAPEVYAVRLKEDMRAIGSVGLLFGEDSNIDIAPGEAEVGYWIGKPFWGRGLIPEAVKVLAIHAFCGLNCTKLWCLHFEENAKSCRVIEKCGFRYEYTLAGVRWDLIDAVKTQRVYSLGREDFLLGR